ncbi:ABC transporter permease [Candidatus Bipolaricaulota bacterium]|nr:ABC transporter permease [Candidatus Bipolaricaulota bacterium]
MNRPKILYKMFVANAKEFFRDRASLFWMIAFPLIFTFIFGMVFSGNDEVVYSLGISVDKETPITKELVNQFDEIESFNVSTGEIAKELEELERGNRKMVLEIPGITREGVTGGKSSTVRLYYSQGEQETNRALISAIKEIFSGIEREVTGRAPLFQLEPEPLETRELTNFDYVMPGILAMALMQLGLFGVFQFMSLRENKVIRGLAVTPLPRDTFFESEVALRLIIAVIQTFLIILIGRTVFGVKILGSIPILIGLVVLGALTFVSMGYMIASFSRTLEGGRNLVQTVQFPMMFLSGIFFPIEFMPGYIRPIVKAIPLTYLGDALRQVMVGYPPEYSLSTDVYVLTGWFLASTFLAIRFWKWE